MSTTNSAASSSLTRHRYSTHCRSHASILRQPHLLSRNHANFMGNQGLRFRNFSITCKRIKSVTKMEMGAANDIIQGATTPPGPNFPGWSNWLLGAALSVLLPLIRHQWGSIKSLEKAVDKTLETVETVADAVEEIAEEAEKAAEEVSEKSPDNVKLKEAMSKVERFAEEAVTDAKEVGSVVKEVEEIETEVEKVLNPIIDNAKAKGITIQADVKVNSVSTKDQEKAEVVENPISTNDQEKAEVVENPISTNDQEKAEVVVNSTSTKDQEKAEVAVNSISKEDQDKIEVAVNSTKPT